MARRGRKTRKPRKARRSKGGGGGIGSNYWMLNTEDKKVVMDRNKRKTTLRAALDKILTTNEFELLGAGFRLGRDALGELFKWQTTGGKTDSEVTTVITNAKEWARLRGSSTLSSVDINRSILKGKGAGEAVSFSAPSGSH